MTTPSLPTELLATIGGEKALDTKDHHSLVLVNRRFRDIFTPVLYSSLQFLIGDPNLPLTSSSSSIFELVGRPLRQLLQLLDCSSKHRHFVSVVDFKRPITGKDPWEDAKSDPLGSLTEHIMALIARFPSLKTLHLLGHHLHADRIIRILSQASSLSELNITQCQVTGEPTVDCSFALNILHLNSSAQVLAPFVIGRHLRHLKVNVSLNRLKDASASYELPLSSLKSLSFNTFTGHALDFFQHTPNLSKLVVTSISHVYDDGIRPPNWTNMLSQLEHYRGPAVLIPLFVSGRPVTSIRCYEIREKRKAAELLSSLGPSFSSRAAMRIVEWSCYRIWDLLLYVVKDSSQLQILNVFAQPAQRCLTKVSASNLLQI